MIFEGECVEECPGNRIWDDEDINCVCPDDWVINNNVCIPKCPPRSSINEETQTC